MAIKKILNLCVLFELTLMLCGCLATENVCSHVDPELASAPKNESVGVKINRIVYRE